MNELGMVVVFVDRGAQLRKERGLRKRGSFAERGSFTERGDFAREGASHR